MMLVHCQDEGKQSIFKQSWKMNGLWSRGWSFHTETERWGKKAKEWKGGETVPKNPDESPKIICTQETEHRERECEGMRERGSLAFTTGASPKHITRATHKYFNTHTHTHQTAWLIACTATEERARQGENVEAHASHIHPPSHRNWCILTLFRFDCSGFSYVSSVMCACSVWEYNTWCG